MLKYLLLLTFFLNFINCEIYTSVDQIKRWGKLENLISSLIEDSIQIEENRLVRLKNIKSYLLDEHNKNDDKYTYASTNDDDSVLHPVKAFVRINKLTNVIANILEILDEARFDSEDLEHRILKLNDKHNLPNPDDVSGSGEAILRLQAFYDLKVDDIVKGKLLNNNNKSSNTQNILMNTRDCFEIGKLAFENGQNSISFEWFVKALELRSFDEYDPKLTELTIDLLDYMSFTSFKLGNIKTAADLTKLWLELDPSNERASENLLYYEEELEQISVDVPNLEDKCESMDDDEFNGNIKEDNKMNYVEFYKSNKKFSTSDYELAEDEVVRSLCRNSNEYISNSKNLCFKKLIIKSGQIYPDIKIEQLHSSPNVFRVHDIITEDEAQYLQKLAKTRLVRSTVQSRYGSGVTKFRIAKTAWLSSDIDPIVDDLEKRLSDIFQIDMNDSEDFQVVNYGLGGYYGPHLDSARETSAKEKNDKKTIGLYNNDRLATILIYLNHVEAGGATAFPKLNLTVEPIERSAVLWYNIKPDGFTDHKTLHTGCPVLLGSKWIATKWPRENDNIFRKQFVI